MATISIDYDSNGDVELILESQNNTYVNEAEQQASQSSEQEKPAKYNVGPLAFRVKEFRLRVSSLKLISSSRYFQAMLEGSRFRESEELKDHGSVKIRLSDPEDEPTAMMIVLGILYDNDVQIPDEIDLEMLDRIAILVDKYQWHALVTPRAISWFDSLSKSRDFADAFDDTLLTRLFITWLFGMRDHFKVLSRIAQQDACNSIDLTDENIRLSTKALRVDIALEVVQEVPELLAKPDVLDILRGRLRLSKISRDYKSVMSMCFGRFTGVCSPIDTNLLLTICLSLQFRTEAINEQREVAFGKVEQVLESFRGRLLQREAQKDADLLPQEKMIKCMVFGLATFCSRDLELGEFAASDHAGSSIRLLRNRIDLCLSAQGFTVKPPNNGRTQTIIPDGDFDLKSKLQEAINELKIDEWGLDYDDFKPLIIGARSSRAPDLE